MLQYGEYRANLSTTTVQGPGGVTVSPTLLGAILVWKQLNYLKLLLIVTYFGST